MLLLLDVVDVLREYEDRSSKEVVVEARLLLSKPTEVQLSAEVATSKGEQFRTSLLLEVLDVVGTEVVFRIRTTTEVGINLGEV